MFSAYDYTSVINFITTACRGQSSLTLTYPTPASGLTYAQHSQISTASQDENILFNARNYTPQMLLGYVM